MTKDILSEETIRLAVEAYPNGMIMTDADGKIVLVNAEVERLFGYSRADILGKSVDTLVPAMREAHLDHLSSLAENPAGSRMGLVRDLQGLRKNGTKVPLDIGLSPIRTATGLMVLSTITDITRRTLAEKRLSVVGEREQLFIAAVESSNDAVVTKTLDGIVTGWNPGAERLFGFTAQEAIGKSIDIIVPAELRSEVRMILDRIGRGEKVDHHETTRVTKDGRRIEVSLSISPIKSPDGEIIGVAKVARDITAKKRIQDVLAMRSEELQRSNADLEQFANVASHDLQEPLRMVVIYTERLAEHCKGRLDDKAEKYIRYAVDGAKRMQELVKALLAYSRVDSQGRTRMPVESRAVVHNVLHSLKIAIEESEAEIVCEPLPVVNADEVQLAQVFQNLIGNALKFHGERAPRIHIGATPSNGTWVFRVEDNGIGIDRQYAELVFQMFQRLHERGRYDGSGIGLSIAKKIVERHGGRIWFDSQPEKGSTFFFTMPALQGEAA